MTDRADTTSVGINCGGDAPYYGVLQLQMEQAIAPIPTMCEGLTGNASSLT